MTLSISQNPCNLVQDLIQPECRDGLWLWWLGQAGFVLRFQQRLIIIDPYLSDSLAKKYAGTFYPHVRMMQIPVPPESLHGIDLVLCTHAHSDHMDPETLRPIAANNPQCRFVVPAAVADTAVARGIPPDLLFRASAGRAFSPMDNVMITPTASAHENLQTDSNGDQMFLGYVMQLGSVKLYHSGDCIPYDGLAARLKTMHIDIALLPVNGRDDERRRHGVAGNFHFDEAAQLCLDSGIPCMLPHHFGMFDFNTIGIGTLQRQARKYENRIQCIIPQVAYRYHVTVMQS